MLLQKLVTWLIFKNTVVAGTLDFGNCLIIILFQHFFFKNTNF